METNDGAAAVGSSAAVAEASADVGDVAPSFSRANRVTFAAKSQRSCYSRY